MEKCLHTYNAAMKNFVCLAERTVLDSADTASFYKFIRSRIGTNHVSVNIISEETSEPITDDKVCANYINNFFQSVFIEDTDDTDVIKHIDIDVGNPFPNLFITRKLVVNAIKHLRANASPGPDGIHPIVLKAFASAFAVPLTKIYCKSLNSSTLPMDWKIADIIPLYKGKGNSNSRRNYRPISLTSHCCKLLERILKDWILSHVLSENLLCSRQHGFLPGRSIQTNLLPCMKDWTSALDRGYLVDVIYIDVSKAFDSVSHNKLLNKLYKTNIHSSLYNWISDFILNRRQRVKVNNSYSDYVPVTSGVPQGSVLGPLLFALYMNDLPSVVKNSKVQIYADDTKIYFCYDESVSPLELQEDLDNVVKWFNTWLLEIAVKKCYVLHLSRNGHQPTFRYKIKGETIPYADGSFRDL
jgi:hypothetical protein